MASSGNGHEVTRRLLDEFLVDNHELEDLSARISRFNVFAVMHAEHAEIRHSYVLAWLLDPQGSHSLGDAFLRRFLSRLLLNSGDVRCSLNPARVELMSLSDVEVFREWQNIDILVRSGSQNWALVIENKIKSGESEGQLARYAAAVAREMPGVEIIPVFLTLDGDAPSAAGKDAGFVSLTHSEIVTLLARLLQQRRTGMGDGARLFLEHYLETLRRLTMQDDELVQLCKTIYRRHRAAIDLIVEYGQASSVLDGCQSWVDAQRSCFLQARTGNRVFFLPQEMADAQAEVAFSGGWGFLNRPLPISWWFYYQKAAGKLQLSMELGPVANGGMRRRLLEEIRAAGFRFWEGAMRDDAKYTRIVTESAKLRVTDEGTPDDDEPYVHKIAGGLWTKAWDKGREVVPILSAFDWNS